MRKIIGSAIAAVALAWTTTASANIFNCAKGCLIDPADGWIEQDFTVPTNGPAKRWDFWFENAPDDLYFALQSPNQIDAFFTHRDRYGDFITNTSHSVSYEFSAFQEENHLWYIVKGPTSFNRCSETSPVGKICAADYNIFGNGTYLMVSGSAPFTVFSRVSIVPEPTVWAMMIAGLGLAGSALRRRRVAAA